MSTSVICTVDVVLLTLHDNALHVALFKRDREPFAGVWSLPGGYVHAQGDADAHDAAQRVLREKTGLEGVYIEQLGTFSGPARDPRGWSVSIAHYALVPLSALAASPAMCLVPVASLKGLAFDHKAIIDLAVSRVRNKSTYSSLGVFLCPDVFTLPQLQQVYECLLGEPINKVSFRRKLAELDILEELPGRLEQGRSNRPAQLYRLKPSFHQRLALTSRVFNPD